MNEISVKVVGEGHKNCTLQVSGILFKEITNFQILKFADLSHDATGVKLESVLFAIQEKAGLFLNWTKGKETSLILPLESRGVFNFEGMQCINSPEATDGISISAFGVPTPKAFLLMLDMGKQR